MDETDTVSENELTYTGVFTFRIYDVRGNFTGTELTGTIAASRVTVNSMSERACQRFDETVTVLTAVAMSKPADTRASAPLGEGDGGPFDYDQRHFKAVLPDRARPQKPGLHNCDSCCRRDSSTCHGPQTGATLEVSWSSERNYA